MSYVRDTIDCVEIRFLFTQSARKHRIAKGRAKQAMANAVLVDIQDRGNDRFVGMFVGVDSRGLELEVGIVGTNDALPTWLIIHVMPRIFR